MSATALPFLIIEPTDPRYKQVIGAAIKSQDKETLSALRGNTNKPICFVTNYFYYALMRSSHDTPTDDVVVCGPEARTARANLIALGNPVESAPYTLTIPADTYDFLL